MLLTHTLFTKLLLLCFANTSVAPTNTTPPITINIVYDTTASAVRNADTIFYTPIKKLNWSNFKASVPTPNASGNVANSSVGFLFRASMVGNSKGTTVNITIKSYFIPSSSWGVAKNKTEYILAHEQLHFDIARLGAAMLTANLRNATYTTSNLSQQLTSMYQKSWDSYLALQAKYDKETNHSIIKTEQEKWNLKVQNELKNVAL